MKDIRLFRRGQVWFIPQGEPDANGHIQGGSRPYLIVSNDTCNLYSPVLHVAPITSREKTQMPTHIKYRNDKNYINTILVEQVTLMSTSKFNKPAKYLYEISEDMMKQVDEAIKVQFSLDYAKSPYNLEEMHDDEDTEAEAQREITESYAEVAIAIESEHTVPTGLERFMKRYNIPEKSVSEPTQTYDDEIERTSDGKIRWSQSMKEKFLRDVEIMSEENVRQKYNMTRSTYHTRKSKFKRELQSIGRDSSVTTEL